MKDDFNAVTELMTEHRPMFAASLAEAVLFGGYLCWKNPLVGICLILISLLQVIPPLLVKNIFRSITTIAGKSKEKLRITRFPHFRAL